jgi:hypothetical protein
VGGWGAQDDVVHAAVRVASAETEGFSVGAVEVEKVARVAVWVVMEREA